MLRRSRRSACDLATQFLVAHFQDKWGHHLNHEARNPQRPKARWTARANSRYVSEDGADQAARAGAPAGSTQTGNSRPVILRTLVTPPSDIMASPRFREMRVGQQQQSTPQIIIGLARQREPRFCRHLGPLLGGDETPVSPLPTPAGTRPGPVSCRAASQCGEPRRGSGGTRPRARRGLPVLLEEDRRKGRIRQAIGADQRRRAQGSRREPPAREKPSAPRPRGRPGDGDRTWQYVGRRGRRNTSPAGQSPPRPPARRGP